MLLTSLITIRQQFPRPRCADAGETLRAELIASGVACPPGARIAIALGSRGIANLAVLALSLIEWIREQGGVPFVVPAMGSHGGATAEGQRQVLAGYGVSEATMGVPIQSSLEVCEFSRGAQELPVYFDRHAAGADYTILLNRIKPHTSFHGRYESGLMKMLAIGLGKHKQALAIHERGVEGLRDLMPRVAKEILRQGNILLGIGVVENAFDETMRICAIPAAEIPECEPELLELARRNMPRLPVDDIDILIIDEIGKDISGLGMDPNIIGRLKIRGQIEPERPRIKVIIVRDLSEATHGNATGMGLADIITRRAADKIDFAVTYTNVATTGFLERAKLPLVAESDEQALAIALRACGPIPPEELRIVQIRNTLHLDEVKVSPALVVELQGRPDIV